MAAGHAVRGDLAELVLVVPPERARLEPVLQADALYAGVQRSLVLCGRVDAGVRALVPGQQAG